VDSLSEGSSNDELGLIKKLHSTLRQNGSRNNSEAEDEGEVVRRRTKTHPISNNQL
jgi:hypothetical protein